MAHRIRYAMSQPPYLDKLSGVVEADESWIGGTRKGGRGRIVKTVKRPVFSIVKRGGDIRSFHVERVTAENVVGIIRENVSKSAHISTDQSVVYDGLGARFAAHVTVNHSIGEYRKGYAHTNTLEGYFSLLKRGLNGTYHHVNENHLHRYLGEFDFRYNNRKIKDAERAQKALAGVVGKRLQLREPSNGMSLSEKANS